MSGPWVHGPDARDHERARELAAARPDGFLAPPEEAWLDAHLAGCGPCRAVADAYAAQSDLFSPGRQAMPEAPRDLWARTSAAIEAEDHPRRAGRRFRLATLVYAPLAGALVVAVAVGAGLLNGLPARESTSKGEEPAATPFVLEAGEVTLLSRGEDGSLEFRRQVVDEVCPPDAESCGLNPTPEVTQTEPFAERDTDTWSAIISPDSGNVVVMDRDGSTGVYVLPLHSTTAAPTDPPATAPPTTVPTEAPATESPTPAPTEAPATSLPSPVGSPDTSPAATDAATPDPGASTLPSDEPPASAVPSTSPDPTPTPTAEPTPDPTAEPSPSVEVTPRPDGAIEIASDVVLVGTSASYSHDGSRFAFTARPADDSAGPDVYVWRVGDKRARAVTNDHASQFSGWLGEDLLVSRVEDGEARTVLLALGDRSERPVHPGPMWRPTVGPAARTGVWWDGTVKPDPDGHSWIPARGALVLETWPAGEGDRQVLAETGVTDWQVQWDPEGRLLAVWTTTGDPGEPGTLSLYDVDRETGTVNRDDPRLDAEPAYEGFSLRSGRLTWSAPGDDGDSTVHVLAWDGDTFGRLEIVTEGGTTVVR